MSTYPPAVTALRVVVGDLADSVAATPDPDLAHDQAEQLVAELRALLGDARLLRARQVLRMSQSGMSMAAIGRRLRVTKGRVHHVITAARRAIAAAEAEQQEAA